VFFRETRGNILSKAGFSKMERAMWKKLQGMLLAFLISGTVCFAQAQNGSWALMFDISDTFNVKAFKDGYQGGAGCKYYAWPTLAFRALADIDFVTAVDPVGARTVNSALSLGLGVEKHLKTEGVSPYWGGLLGARTLSQTGQPNRIDFYFGALFGLEVAIFRNFSLFAEYDLVASLGADGFSIRLGNDKGTLFGVAVYF